MSGPLGNSKDNHGSKGSRYSYERIHLAQLKSIVEAIQGTGGSPPPAGIATEATLLNILAAIDASTQDAEILLVRDTGDSDVVVQQITTWEDGSPTVAYKKVDGSTHTVIGPLEYIDLAGALTLILGELTASGVTHVPLVTSGAGSVAAGSLRGSMLNVGDADGIWNGQTIPPGVGVPWGHVGNRDTYAAITYDATGTTFVIESTIVTP